MAILVPATLVLGVWIARHFMLREVTRPDLLLRADRSEPLPAPAPPVTVLVPAKDEEANIAECLATLRAQDYSDLEIIVIDDRSTDRTAEIVRQIADEDSRVRLVRVAELPPGWFGKPHAMFVGAQQARGQWLLFVDADCRQAPGSIRAAVAYATARGADMLSLWPLLEMHGFAENLVQPLCGSILGLWFRPSLVNDPRRRAAFANGQFILIRRDMYERVGGHEVVRNRLLEDIWFARAVKGSGARLLNAIGFDMFSTRMYDRLAAVWRGWSRIFSNAFTSPWTLVAAFALVLLMSGSPFVLAIVAGTLAAGAGWSDVSLNVLAALGAAQVVAMMSVLVRYNRMIRARPAYLVLYPLSVLIVLGILLNALLAAVGLTRVRWRGTTYTTSGRVS
ncbi:MAG TPA: glycosyltransferase family 2 protein [Vicinamibacterales bacterium]|nr:glycosyltransferase family 2 protein [Vicinamibacterales bacterium]